MHEVEEDREYGQESVEEGVMSQQLCRGIDIVEELLGGEVAPHFNCEMI